MNKKNLQVFLEKNHLKVDVKILNLKGLNKMSSIEARKKNVRVALSYNSLDQGEPSKYCLELLNEYIRGNIEPRQVTKKIIRRYSAK